METQPFKSAITNRIDPEKYTAPAPKETEGLEIGGPKSKADDFTEKPLDVWEFENGKVIVSYFEVKNIAHTFPIKAELGAIDKYIKSEMKEREMELSKENFEKILSEIEDEIGTKEKEKYKRINRIFNYIKVVNKYQDIKKKREAYYSSKD